MVDAAFELRDAALAYLDAGDPVSALECAAQAVTVGCSADPLAEGADLASLLLVRSWAEADAGLALRAHASAAEAARQVGAPLPGDADTLPLWGQIELQIAQCEHSNDEAESAEARLTELIATVEPVLGAADHVVLAAWNALGILYKYAARFDEAHAAYNHVQQALNAAPDHDLLLDASLLHNLAGLHHATGNTDEGIPLAEHGLAIRQAELGDDHPDVAADRNALGALYQMAGRADDARRCYHDALAIFRRVYGDAHLEVAMTLANLAALAADCGQHEQAIGTGTAVLAMLEQIAGPDHREVGLTLHNLGVAHSNAGDPQAAVEALERAHNVLTRTLPAGHPQLAETTAALQDARQAARR